MRARSSLGATHLRGSCHHLGGWPVATQMQKMALILTSARLTMTWFARWIRICGPHGHRWSPSTPTLYYTIVSTGSPESDDSPTSQKATVLRHAIWNQVPRRALASWCRLLGRRKPRQRQSANGLPQPARMLPHRWNGIRGRLVATAGASTLPNRRSLMRGLAAGRANRDGVDAAFAGREREWS